MISIPCDIVLLPETGIAERAISLSQKLQKHAPLFVLGENMCVPHTSLYMLQIKSDQIVAVKELLAKIASQTPAVQAIATGYVQAEGYIDANYERTEELGALQMTVINAVNPLRDGLRGKDRMRLLTATGAVRKNLETYGYRGAGELFRPHLTLTRFTDEKHISTDNLPESATFSGALTRIALFEMGDNGTCTRKIAEFDLKG